MIFSTWNSSWSFTMMPDDWESSEYCEISESLATDHRRSTWKTEWISDDVFNCMMWISITLTTENLMFLQSNFLHDCSVWTFFRFSQTWSSIWYSGMDSCCWLACCFIFCQECVMIVCAQSKTSVMIHTMTSSFWIELWVNSSVRVSKFVIGCAFWWYSGYPRTTPILFWNVH